MDTIRYGNDNTIYGTPYVNVEVDKNGTVRAVWFRCMRLPFKQAAIEIGRVNEMEREYEDDHDGRRLVAVELEIEANDDVTLK